MNNEYFFEYVYDSKGNLTNVKVLIPNVVEYLMNKYIFKTIFHSKSEEIWIYQDGIYTKDGREIIQTKTEELLGEHCKNYHIKEIVEKIKRLTAISKEEFEKNYEVLICVENGILDLKKNEFIEHDPKYYFKNKINIIYNKEADCPMIKKFLGETLYPEDLDVVQEWFGFCLYKKYFIKKAMIIFGDTDTGKTVFLNLLINFIGDKNISGISLQRIAISDKFALASLKDKFANVYDDLSSKDLTSGGFKLATGGGYITAEYKFGDPFQFLTFAKHTFATNKIPAIKDIDAGDMAYYDRWIPIPFDNQIDKSEQDRFLLSKLTTPEEMSGLLNWALDGLKHLLDKGTFSFDKNPEDVKLIMERQSNPLVAFCQDTLIQQDGNKISKDMMFEMYTYYVNFNKMPRLSKEQLGRRLYKVLPYILAKHSSDIRYWENVGINPNVKTMDTYDTFKSIIRVGFSNLDSNDIDYNNIYMLFSEVSLLPQQKVGDTLDIEQSTLDTLDIEPKEEEVQ